MFRLRTIPVRHRVRNFVALALTALALLANTSSARADVEVVLRGGQRVRAQTVRQSADGRTWLLTVRAEGIELTRRVPRGAVESIGDDVPRAVVSQADLPPVRLATWTNLPLTSAIVTGPMDPVTIGTPGPCVPDACAPGCAAGGYSRVLGVRDDPLQAYGGDLFAVYPNGVPLDEVPYALDLLRARRAAESLPVLPPPWLAPPSGIPAPPH